MATTARAPLQRDHISQQYSDYDPYHTDNFMAHSSPLSEDPLEAIDALEDAIEEVGQALPTVVEDDRGLDSPTKPRRAANGPETPRRHNGSVEQTGAGRSPVSTSKKHGGHTDPRQTSISSSTAAPGRRYSGTSQRSESSGKLSVHKPAFIPQKSGKQPTRPTFELPGEAISRRKRAEIEERRRKEEEELRARKAFKARPVGFGAGQSTDVRETASSRARANRVSQVIEPRSLAPVTPRPENSRPVSVIGASALSDSPLVQRTPLGRSQSVRSNQSQKPTTPARSISRSENPKTPATGAKGGTTGTHTAKGKEVWARVRAREEERKKQEEAAKRARAEAAERSRELSRAWAEKQRQKTGS